jgi:hypothetical protein
VVGSRISIERTENASLIKTLASHPAIFKHINDDFHQDPETWQPPSSSLIVSLVARDDRGYFGFGIFIPQTWVCYRGHFAFLPRSYGEDSITAFRLMLDWMWQNTKAARIIGEICRDNKRAIRFAMRAGCKAYGINPQSQLRGGVLRDQVCLGISRP